MTSRTCFTPDVPSSPVFFGSPSPLNPAQETFCHALSDGGKTDWKLAYRQELLDLFGNGVHDYAAFSADSNNTYYATGYHVAFPNNQYSINIRPSDLNEWNIDDEGYALCTRIP